MSYELRSARFLASEIRRRVVQPDDTVIDATMGNGHDTLELARLVGPGGRVYGFDVQRAALENTEARLREAQVLEQCSLHLLGHEHIPDIVPCPVRYVSFNLGWLPGGDKHITTKTETTIKAVRDAMELICSDGLVCITMYSGHPEGRKEKAALLEFAEDLDAAKWHCAYISMPNQKNNPPEILLITKKAAR